MFGYKFKTSYEHLNSACNEFSKVAVSASNVGVNLTSAAYKMVPIASAAYVGLQFFGYGVGKIMTAHAINSIPVIHAIDPTFITKAVDCAHNILVKHDTAALVTTVASTVLTNAGYYVAGCAKDTYNAGYHTAETVAHLGSAAIELGAASICAYSELKNYLTSTSGDKDNSSTINYGSMFSEHLSPTIIDDLMGDVAPVA